MKQTKQLLAEISLALWALSETVSLNTKDDTRNRRLSLHTLLVLMLALVGGLNLTHARDAIWQASFGLMPQQMSPPWDFADSLGRQPALQNNYLLLDSTGAASAYAWFQQSGTSLVFTVPFVMEARVRLVSGSDLDPNRAPIGLGCTTSPEVGNILQIEVGRIFLYDANMNRGPSVNVDTTSTPHTYRMEVDGLAAGSTVNIFYDGAPVLSGVMVASYAHGSAPRVLWGDYTASEEGVSEWYSVWHNALTEFPTLMPTNGLISWWRADYNTVDSVGGHHGYLTNGAAFASGHIGQAFTFPAPYAKAQFPGTTFGSLDITNDQLTVAAWINLATHSHPLGTGHTIFDKYWGPAPSQWNGYLLFVSGGSGRLVLNLATTGQADFWIQAGQPVPTNQWQHVAATYDGHHVRLYADGLLVAVAPQTGNILHNGLDASIGNDNGEGGCGFNGLIDEVMVFGRSLGADEMENLYVAQGGHPRLHARPETGAIGLSWPGTAEGYGLQTATILPTGSWEPVTNAPSLNGTQKEVLMPASTPTQRFFRLSKPGP